MKIYISININYCQIIKSSLSVILSHDLSGRRIASIEKNSETKNIKI